MQLTPEQIQGILELEPRAQVDRLQGDKPYIRVGYWGQIRDLDRLQAGLAKLGLQATEIDDYDDDTGWNYWYQLNPIQGEVNEAEEDISTTDQMIQYLINMASKGEFNNDQIRDLAQTLLAARKKYFASKRSPESYKAAAEKAKATKARQKKDWEASREYWKAYHDKVDAENKSRRDGGMLPLSLDDYGRHPNPKYYTYVDDDPKSGIGMYKLRDKYKNAIIGTKNADGTINPVTDDDIYYPKGARPSRQSYMEEIDTKRWAKLAGINEALDAQSLIGKYIDISQNVGMSGPIPRTAQDVIDLMPKFENPNLGIQILGTEDPGVARYGHGIYFVQTDGTLKGIRDKYDTSD